MKWYLIISQIFYSITLIPWFFIWGISFMVFDSGIINIYNVSFVLIITLYPIAVILCSFLAWKMRIKKRKLAIIINLVPMIWVIGFSLLLFLS